MRIEISNDELRELGINPALAASWQNWGAMNQLRALLGLPVLRDPKFRLCKYCEQNEAYGAHTAILDYACSQCRECLTHYKSIYRIVAGHNARGNRALNTLTHFEWCKMLISSKGRCHYCNKFVGYERLLVEHVIPICRGGNTTADNVAPACNECNKSKRFKLLHEWKPELYGNPIQSESAGVADAAPISETPQT